MNEVQKIVLQNFKHFSDVCEKLNLTFYLVNGSALGAEKYGGFIPWDDDLDVVMPRKDYEIFLKNGQKLIPKNFFIQNYRTDRRFPFLYSKVRNSDTTFIEYGVKHLDINHGIYMDIFPLDSVEEKFLKNRFKALEIKVMFWFAFCSLNDRSKTKIRIRNAVLRLLGFHKITDVALKRLDKIVSYDNPETLYCCNYADRQGKGLILREWYGKGKECLFEGVKVRVPEKIDEYLTYKYGDWRSDLPADEQKSHHKAVICDTEKSFREYLKK